VWRRRTLRHQHQQDTPDSGMGKNSGKIFPEILHPLYTANDASDNCGRVIGPGNYQLSVKSWLN
jgi:hypothetical protein